MTMTEIVGIGSCVPALSVGNGEFEKFLDTSDEWIQTRTGVRERRICTDETAVSLAFDSALKALASAGIAPRDLDLIVVSTITPDNVTPSVACTIQKMLGAEHAAAFDVSAGCTGFVYAVSAADAFIRSGKYRIALVVSVDVLSRVTDWTDRSSCVLFGDGSAAVALKAGEKGILDTYLRSDGDLEGALRIPGNPISNPWHRGEPIPQKLRMDGHKVFPFAVNQMTDALERIGRIISLEKISRFFPHQANVRIIDLVCKNMRLLREKFHMNIDRFGNTSSASIPIALEEASSGGFIHKGDLIALVAFGSGFTWGSLLAEWTMGAAAQTP